MDTREYLLLKVLRCYIEIDLYASFEVHTDQTIMAGREKVAQFYELMQVSLVNVPTRIPNSFEQEYIALEDPGSGSDSDSDSDDEDTKGTKSWDFPKIHLLLHLFDDIVAKGATRNYNTKTNESRHRPLKRIYLFLTNFKDVAEQVGPFTHESVLSLTARADTSL